MKIKFKSYVHGDKDSNRELAFELEEEHGFRFEKDARETFIFHAYEVELTCELDTETGETKILSTK